MKRKYRDEMNELQRIYNRQMHSICKKYKVCTRCRDDSKPLETETMCGDCAHTLRVYQRVYFHIRNKGGK